jgi:hypothetical protein
VIRGTWFIIGQDFDWRKLYIFKCELIQKL